MSDADHIDSRVDSVMEILEKDMPQDSEVEAAPATSDTEPPVKDAIGEGQDKTSEPKEAKPSETSAIEPPNSWPTDDKEAFKSLPSWAQERIVTRENEREAHFSERARTIASREQELNNVQSQVREAQTRYATELQKLSQLSQQLMPAKFNDIQNEADYLRLKVEDPARASEYEAFVQVLRNSQAQSQAEEKRRMDERLNNEWLSLQNKYPEFKDASKAPAIMDEVRKGAVEYYGFNPQEIAVITDHRHVPVLRDALAWRKHQAALKAAEGKKVPATPSTPALRANATAGRADIGTEQRSKILNRAGKEGDLRKRADLIAGVL